MDRILFSRTSFPALLAATLLTVAAGCGAPAPQEQAPAAADETPAAAETQPAAAPDVYRIRGQVVEVPDPEDPMSAFYVYHEAIDDFRDMDGEVSGMDSMTMPFPMAEGISFENVAEGDAVAFTLEVDWEGDPLMQVTAVEKLAAGTELEFRRARPAGDAAEAEAENGDTENGGTEDGGTEGDDGEDDGNEDHGGH